MFDGFTFLDKIVFHRAQKRHDSITISCNHIQKKSKNTDKKQIYFPRSPANVLFQKKVNQLAVLSLIRILFEVIVDEEEVSLEKKKIIYFTRYRKLITKTMIFCCFLFRFFMSQVRIKIIFVCCSVSIISHKRNLAQSCSRQGSS